MIRVVIAEDHHLVREGIRALLERADGITVVGEAMDGEGALEMARQLKPDVLLMDIAMPKLNGIQVAEILHNDATATNIVILSMYTDEITVRQALHNGVKGFLPKGSVSTELLFAIQAAARGATYLSPSISGHVLGKPNPPSKPPTKPGSAALTVRERQLLQLIGKGQTNAQMAQSLNISIKTVERHRMHLMQKLDARNLAELLRVAIAEGLIPLNTASDSTK